MNMMGLFNSDNLKNGKKRKALRNILDKLDRTKRKLEKKLKADDSKVKIKRLETRLRTNKKQRKKAKKLLSEID